MSFRHVGEAKSHQSPSRYANYVDDARGRRVAVYQKRNLSDILFPFLVGPLFKRSGKFWFSLTCRSTEEERIGKANLDSLLGEICIFKSKADWSRFVEADSLLSDINDARRGGRLKAADNAYERFRAGAASFSDILVEFKLYRNGEAYFKEPIFSNEALEKTSSEYSDSKIGVPFKRWVSDQAYFFLRDVCHFHQHHAPSEDTIIILQDLNTKRGWRNNILYSLQHYVIRQRRSLWVVDLHRALGVLAYAKAFIGLSELVISEEQRIQQFQFEAICESINSRIAEIDKINHFVEQNRSWRISKMGSVRGAGLSFIAIACSLLIAVMQPYFQSNRDSLLIIGNWVTAHWSVISVSSIIFIVLFWIITEESFQKKDSPRLEWGPMPRNILGFRDLAALGMLAPRLFGVLFITISVLMLFVLFRMAS